MSRRIDPELGRAAATLGRLCRLVAVCALLGTPALAQTPLERERTVTGRVLRPGIGASAQPVIGAWVVLHRVGPDSAAPLDSLRTGRDGAFRFRYRAFGDPDALYFLSASYAGIAYFGPPLRGSAVSGDAGEILVYDTTSAPVPLHVRGRHLVVGAPGSEGFREIVEVFEIANDSTVTRVAPDEREPTWFSQVPAGAFDFRVGQGDVAEETVRLENGRVVVTAPFAPGLKQLSFAYRLPSRAFPVRVPITGGSTVLEVLLEEPDASASGAGLERVQPVNVEGRSFSRFLAKNVEPSAVVSLNAPSRIAATDRTRWIVTVATVVAVVLLLGAIAILVRGRRRAVPAATPALTEPARAVARRIAELDEAYEREGADEPDRRARYERERAELKDELRRTLAGEPPPA